MRKSLLERLALSILSLAAIVAVQPSAVAQIPMVKLEVCCGSPAVCTTYTLVNVVSTEEGSYCVPVHTTIPASGCIDGNCTGNMTNGWPLGHVVVRVYDNSNNYGEFGVPPAVGGNWGSTGPLPLGGFLPSGTSTIKIQCPITGVWMNVGTIKVC